MKTTIRLLIISVASVVFVCNAAFAESGYIKHISAKAQTGQAWAEKAMGDALYFGIDMEPDHKKAVEWYKKAAKQGDSSAMHLVGRSYYFGEGIKQNYKKAAEEYRKAADSGDGKSLYSLAQMYQHGIGVNQDLPEAEELYKKAIYEHLYTDSLYPLARMYWESAGFDENILILLILAGDYAGDTAAQHDIEYNKLLGALSPAQRKLIRETADIRWGEINEANAAYEKRVMEESGESEVSLSEMIAVAEGASESLSAEEVFNRVWRSIVSIENEEIGTIGSGVIVQPDIVATNCHVIDGEDEFWVNQPKKRTGTENEPYSATIIGRATGDRDYCLLYVPDLPISGGIPATIRPYKTLNIGEVVYALGAPDGEILSLSKGIISQLRGKGAYAEIQSDVDIAGGSSGGGLFDSAGNLIGHTTYGLIDREIGSELEGLEFSIPADIILEF